jgi:hypothetical protein
MPKISTKTRSSEDGNVIIIVMITMLLTMLMVSSVVNHFSVSEAREIENGLAKVRAYWAMSGVADYALSRIRGKNEANTDNENITDLNSYFDALDSSDDNKFIYSDVAAEYWLNIKGEAVAHASNTGGNTGRIILTMTLDTSGTVPAISNLATQLLPLNLDACIKSTGSSDCNTDNNGQSWIMEVYRE